MVKFVALYRKPEDEETFQRRYFEEHMPLVRQFPDLRNVEISRVIWPKDGAWWMMAELTYDDRESMTASIDSEVSRRALAVLQEFVPEDAMTMMMLEVRED